MANTTSFHCYKIKNQIYTLLFINSKLNSVEIILRKPPKIAKFLIIHRQNYESIECIWINSSTKLLIKNVNKYNEEKEQIWSSKTKSYQFNANKWSFVNEIYIHDKFSSNRTVAKSLQQNLEELDIYLKKVHIDNNEIL